MTLPLFDPAPPTREERAATLAALPPVEVRPRFHPFTVDPCGHLEACPGCAECDPHRPSFGPCSGCGCWSLLATQYPGALCEGCQVAQGGEVDESRARGEGPVWRPGAGELRAALDSGRLPWESREA